jgi:hypothetical protein
MPVEYTCCECGVHVIAYAPRKLPEPPLCAVRLMMPGWMNDVYLRGVFGRGRELGPVSPCGND